MLLIRVLGKIFLIMQIFFACKMTLDKEPDQEPDPNVDQEPDPNV